MRSFLFFLALAAVFTRPLVLHPFTRTLAGPDPLIDLWTVNWISGHLFSRDLFDGNIFHPFPGAVLYSDLSLGTAVLVAPFRLFLHDPVPLYNAALLLALAFGGWAWALLGRALTGRKDAGLLTGVLAAFGSHQMYHVYHLNLLSTGFIALFVLGLLRLLDRPGPGPVLLAGVSFALSAQSSGYYAVACAVIALVVAAARFRVLRERRTFTAAVSAALLALALTTPYLLSFGALRAREGRALERDPALSERMAFQPARDLSSHGYLYQRVLGSEGERLFPGLLALGLTLVAAVRRRPQAGTLLLAAGALVLLSLGPRLRLFGAELSLPYGALFALPPLDSMRHPYTFAAVASFLLAVVAGIGWSTIGLAQRKWAGATVVALAVLESVPPPLAVREVPGGLPPAYVRLLSLPPGAALDLPVLEPETLLWAARHGRPVVNGAGAFTPLYTATLHRQVRNHWLRRNPEDVDASKPAEFLRRAFDARYVILPTGRRPDLSDLAASFDRGASFRLVAEVEDGDRIYEIVR